MQYIFKSMAATQITILIGTMTGTAQLCAQEMELALGDDQTQVEALLMDNLDASVFDREGAFLICTSTYGQGDVPDNARALYEDLQRKRPDLSKLRYGVFGLGDRTYAETFNYGGETVGDILPGIGAFPRRERHKHHPSRLGPPGEKGVEGCQDLVSKMQEGKRAPV